MLISIIVLLISFAISILLTPLLKQFVVNRGIFDSPHSSRKIHAVPVPTMGGLAIYAAFIIPVLIVYFANHSLVITPAWRYRIAGLLCAGSMVLLMGVYDDIKGAKVWMKLLVQTIASVLIYYFGFKINALTNPFAESFQLGFLGLPLTVLWIVGITNAINLIDGIDGLAVGVIMFASLAIISISVLLGNPVSVLLTAAILGACSGFFRYNFHPAKIFMGDTGSQFLGFMLAVISIGACQKSTTAVALVTPIIILGLPIMETVFSIGRRATNGSSPFKGDLDHFHHRLLSKGYSQRQTVLILYTISVMLGVIGFIFTAATNIFVTAVLLLLALLLLFGAMLFGYFPGYQLRDIRIKR